MSDRATGQAHGPRPHGGPLPSGRGSEVEGAEHLVSGKWLLVAGFQSSRHKLCFLSYVSHLFASWAPVPLCNGSCGQTSPGCLVHRSRCTDTRPSRAAGLCVALRLRLGSPAAPGPGLILLLKSGILIHFIKQFERITTCLFSIFEVWDVSSRPHGQSLAAGGGLTLPLPTPCLLAGFLCQLSDNVRDPWPPTRHSA